MADSRCQAWLAALTECARDAGDCQVILELLRTQCVTPHTSPPPPKRLWSGDRGVGKCD